MAIITEGAGSGNMGSATSPMQAVQGANPLGAIANATGSVFGVMQTQANTDAQAAKAQAILDKDAKKEAGETIDTSLSQSLLKVADRFEQTGDRDEAIRLSRRVLNRALTNPGNAARGDEVIATYTKFMGVQGLGKDFFEESDEEKMMAQRATAAMRDGVVRYGSDTDEQWQAKLDNHAEFLMAGTNLQRSTAEIAKKNALLEQKGKLTSNEKSKIELEIKKAETERSDNLAKSSQTYQKIVDDKFQDIRQRRDDGKLTQQQAEMELTQAMATVTNIINTAAGTGNESQVTALTKPMTDLLTANMRYIKREATLEELNNATATANARTIMLLNERRPDIQQMLAISGAINHSDPALLSAIEAETSQYLANNILGKSDPLPDMSPKSRKQVMDVAVNLMVADTAGRTSEAEKQELTSYMKKIFNDFDKYASSVDNPQQLNELVAMIADPRFGEWVKSNQGIPASISVQVKDTLKAYYSEPVLKDVVQNWEKGVALNTTAFDSQARTFIKSILGVENEGAMTMPMPDILEPVVTASGLSFRGKEGVPSTLVTPALRQVDRDVLPKINRLVKSLAHMEGSNDYQKVFEENYAKILGVMPEEEPKAPKPKLSSEEFEPLEGDTIVPNQSVAGYRYLGGDTADPANWEPING